MAGMNEKRGEKSNNNNIYKGRIKNKIKKKGSKMK